MDDVVDLVLQQFYFSSSSHSSSVLKVAYYSFIRDQEVYTTNVQI